MESMLSKKEDSLKDTFLSKDLKKLKRRNNWSIQFLSSKIRSKSLNIKNHTMNLHPVAYLNQLKLINIKNLVFQEF